jgi:hypothetical protein
MMEIEAVLERAGLTEFERPASGPLPHINKWCQSGAQAGWAPDIDEVRVTERSNFVEIDNDIYSGRVIKLAADLRKLGCKVTLSFEPKTVEELRNLGIDPAMIAEAVKEAS